MGKGFFYKRIVVYDRVTVGRTKEGGFLSFVPFLVICCVFLEKELTLSVCGVLPCQDGRLKKRFPCHFFDTESISNE